MNILKKTISFLGALALAGVCGAASAALIDPTDPNLAPFTLEYGDFSVISLQFADTALGTSAYYVPSSPGQIRNDVVVGTGAGGTFANDGTGSMDAPYATPTDAHDYNYFQTGDAISSPDPGGAGQFAGDTANTWDASLSDLNAALNGAPAVFYFNLNETGTTGTLAGTDLLMWAKVSLIDNSGVLDPISFYLAGSPFDSGAGVVQSKLYGGPVANPGDPGYSAADPRWTYVHGDICVSGSTFIHYGSCTNSDPAGAQTIDQNLGANQAAFAGYNLELDRFIQNPCVNFGEAASCYTTMQIDWRMSQLNNGYEQLFIASTGSPPPSVPEPNGGPLMLLGLGLLSLFFGLARWKQEA